MENGKKTGGRKAGVPNKSRDEVKDLLDKLSKKRYKKSANVFIFGKLMELGEGVVCTDKSGDEITVYEKEPNEKALSTLAAYRNGKPAQSVDITSKGEKLSIGVIYAEK
jgi:hypothetical protein